jgi:hypothetical protein
LSECYTDVNSKFKARETFHGSWKLWPSSAILGTWGSHQSCHLCIFRKPKRT